MCRWNGEAFGYEYIFRSRFELVVMPVMPVGVFDGLVVDSVFVLAPLPVSEGK